MDSGVPGGGQATMTRQKPAQYWSCEEVVKWMKRYEAALAEKYAYLFVEHDVNGAALMRLTDETLILLGVPIVRTLFVYIII